jgi:hypothetical protein
MVLGGLLSAVITGPFVRHAAEINLRRTPVMADRLLVLPDGTRLQSVGEPATATVAASRAPASMLPDR